MKKKATLRDLLDYDGEILLFGILRTEIQICEHYADEPFGDNKFWIDRFNRTEALLEKLENA